jgi:starch synthase
MLPRPPACRLMTVSPGYASEIQTWLGGCGMNGLLASRSYVLNGIVNGIDINEWDPAQDKALPMNYDATNFV